MMARKIALPLQKVTIRLDLRDWHLITEVHKGKATEVARSLLHRYADRLRADGFASCKEPS